MEPPPTYADAIAAQQQQRQQEQPKRLPSQHFQRQHQTSVLHVLQQSRPANPVTINVDPATQPSAMPIQANAHNTRPQWNPFIKLVLILGAALAMLTFIKIARKFDERRHPMNRWW